MWVEKKPQALAGRKRRVGVPPTQDEYLISLGFLSNNARYMFQYTFTRRQKCRVFRPEWF